MQAAATKVVSEWQSGQADQAAMLNVTGCTDEQKRLVNKIKQKGTGALASEDFDTVRISRGGECSPLKSVFVVSEAFLCNWRATFQLEVLL